MLVIVTGVSSNNSTAGMFLAKCRDDETTAPRGEIVSEITKKVFRGPLDEDVDPTRATKTSARVETHDCWLTSLKNFARAQRHFVLETTGAERTDARSVFANQHACAGPAIA